VATSLYRAEGDCVSRRQHPQVILVRGVHETGFGRIKLERLALGAMSWSRKVWDLQRDPRCLLHTAISAPDAGEDELKLYGQATSVDERLRQSCGDAWWSGTSRESAVVFSLGIEEATLVSWDLQRGELTARYWSRTTGLRSTTRSYP
jgi:hypothetical protein